MKLYADLPGRRVTQVVSDLFTAGWVLACTYAGRLVHDATATLRRPAEGLSTAGTQLQNGMTSAGDQVAKVPLVGDSLQGPFREAARTGVALTQAGTDLGSAVDRMALVFGVAVARSSRSWCGCWCGCRCGCGSSAGRAQRSDSLTGQPTSTSSHSAPWLASRCTGWPGSTTIRRVPGGPVTRAWSTSWPSSGLLELRLRPPRGRRASSRSAPITWRAAAQSTRSTPGADPPRAEPTDARSARTCSPERMSLTESPSPSGPREPHEGDAAPIGIPDLLAELLGRGDLAR